MDSSGQRGEVAIGEVGSTDPLAKQDIAAEHEGRGGVRDEIDDVARRVARDGPHLEVEAGYAEAFPMDHQPVGGRAGQGQSERGREVGDRVGELCGLVAAYHDRQVGPAGLEKPIAGDVIGMAVGQKDRVGNEALSIDPGHDRVGLEPGIDDDAGVSARAAADVGMFPEGQRLDTGHLDAGRGGNDLSGCHGTTSGSFLQHGPQPPPRQGWSLNG